MENDGSTSAAIVPAETKLFAKMARVMGIINRVPKSGTNAYHKYRYATADDVADVIREALAEVNLAFIVQMGEVKQETIENIVDGKPKSITRTTVKFTFTFACGDTGAVTSSPWVGQVDDNSDKAINKCATSAEKYFLMKTFIVSAGDEPDADADKHTEAARKVTPPPPETPPEWFEPAGALDGLALKAHGNGWIEHTGNAGVRELEAIIAPRTWDNFADRTEAGLYIKQMVEDTQAEIERAKQATISTEDAKTALNGHHGERIPPANGNGNHHYLTVDKVEYNGILVIARTPAGELIKCGTKEAFKVYMPVPCLTEQWKGTELVPESYTLPAPVRLVYQRQGETHNLSGIELPQEAQ